MEGEDVYFSIQFYQTIVYENWIFDMAKLLDLASIFGNANSETVKAIFSNVFEADPRYFSDFKEMASQLISCNKRVLTLADKISKALVGNTLEAMDLDQIEQIKNRMSEDAVELYGNLWLITQYFPDKILEGFRPTNILLYCANTFCVFKHQGA